MPTPLLVVAFGAMSRQAREVYQLLDADLQAQFPERKITWAYTATSIVERLKARGEDAKSLPEALEAFKKQGVEHIEILSIHLVPGEKHQEVLNVNKFGLKVAITSPLLEGTTSIHATAKSVCADCPNDRPVLVVAHGNGREMRYNQELIALKKELKGIRPDLHLTLLEGDEDEAGLNDFIQGAQQAGKVHIYPFLFVAGDHVQNDILGQDEDSFRSKLNIRDLSCGDPLGKRPWVRQAFIQKLADLTPGTPPTKS